MMSLQIALRQVTDVLLMCKVCLRISQLSSGGLNLMWQNSCAIPQSGLVESAASLYLKVWLQVLLVRVPRAMEKRHMTAAWRPCWVRLA